MGAQGGNADNDKGRVKGNGDAAPASSGGGWLGALSEAGNTLRYLVALTCSAPSLACRRLSRAVPPVSTIADRREVAPV